MEIVISGLRRPVIVETNTGRKKFLYFLSRHIKPNKSTTHPKKRKQIRNLPEVIHHYSGSLPTPRPMCHPSHPDRKKNAEVIIVTRSDQHNAESLKKIIDTARIHDRKHPPKTVLILLWLLRVALYFLWIDRPSKGLGYFLTRHRV